MHAMVHSSSHHKGKCRFSNVTYRRSGVGREQLESTKTNKMMISDHRLTLTVRAREICVSTKVKKLKGTVTKRPHLRNENSQAGPPRPRASFPGPRSANR